MGILQARVMLAGFLLVILSSLLLLLGMYGVVHAQAGGAVAICPICDTKNTPPCQTIVCTALNCFGRCVAPGPAGCDVISSGCKNQPEKASAGGADKAMEMAKSIMDALKSKAGGGGGGGGGSPPPPGGAQGQGQQTTPSPANLNDLLNATSSPASFVGTALDRVSTAASSLFSAVFGNNEVTNAEDEKSTGSEARGGEDGLPGQQPVIGSTATSDRAKAGSGIITTGGEEGLAGSVRAFFNQFFNPSAQNAADNESFFNRLCNARPWQATFINRVFSASFFDSLCAQQGIQGAENGIFNASANSNARHAQLHCPAKVKIGNSATVAWDCGQSQSAGFGFNTAGQNTGVVEITPQDTDTYYLRCGNGGRAQCTITVEKPRAQLTAYPAHVPLNARSEIFWTSENVIECTVEGPGFKELGTRGAATTPVILDSVTYTMVCHDEAGRTAYDSVTVGVGN